MYELVKYLHGLAQNTHLRNTHRNDTCTLGRDKMTDIMGVGTWCPYVRAHESHGSGLRDGLSELLMLHYLYSAASECACSPQRCGDDVMHSTYTKRICDRPRVDAMHICTEPLLSIRTNLRIHTHTLRPTTTTTTISNQPLVGHFTDTTCTIEPSADLEMFGGVWTRHRWEADLGNLGVVCSERRFSW